jgi:hypothetical protein
VITIKGTYSSSLVTLTSDHHFVISQFRHFRLNPLYFFQKSNITDVTSGAVSLPSGDSKFPPESRSSPLVFCGVHVAQSLVSCVKLLSFCHCIACPLNLRYKIVII